MRTIPLALDFFQLEQYKESAGLLMRVQQSSSDTALAGRARGCLNLSLLSNLEIPDLRVLSKDARQLETKAFISLASQKKFSGPATPKAAREALQPVLALPPGSSRRSDAEALLDRIDRSGVVKVGIVLPLTLKSDQTLTQSVGRKC